MDIGVSYPNLKHMMPTQVVIIFYMRTSQCALSLLYHGHFANGEAGGGALKRREGEYSAAGLDRMRKQMCLLSSEACKHIQVVTKKQMMNPENE